MKATRLAAALGSDTSIYRHGLNGSPPGNVIDIPFPGRLTFDVVSTSGDSGGAYLLRYSGSEYIIGTHNGNTGSGDASGTYFSASEWTDINRFFEGSQSGDVTSSEPTNLVVGTGDIDVITGSYRPDILLGRGGDDSISDGDGLGDTVWADDTLVGGDGGDLFFAGRGNDVIWGGNKDETTEAPGNGEDQVSYDTAGAVPVTITYDGTGAAPSLTVSSSLTDTDTLHAIERVVATSGADYFNYSGSIAQDYRLTIDFRGGGNDVTNGGNAAAGLQLSIAADGAGTLTDTATGGVISLLNAHTQIIGSAYDDEIADHAVHDGLKRIGGGAGNDEITASGSDAMIKGGAGDDTLTGGAGNDVIAGEAGTNILEGGGGSDMLIAGGDDAFAPILDGGAGNDVIDWAATPRLRGRELGRRGGPRRDQKRGARVASGGGPAALGEKRAIAPYRT